MKEILLLIFAGMCMQTYGSQSPASDNAQHIAGLLAKEISSINYIQCRMEIRGVSGFKEGENLRMTIDWKENSEGCFYRDLTVERNGIQSSRILTVWDGNQFLRMNAENKKMLIVEKNLPLNISNFNIEQFPLNPYQFLVQTKHNQNTIIPSLSIIRSLGTRINNTKHSATDTEAHIYSGGFCPWTNSPYKISVTWEKDSKDNFVRPIKWKKFLPEERLECELVVSSWNKQEGARLFPESFTMTYFKFANGGHVPTYCYQTDIKDLKLNSEPDDAFIVDPAEADFIYDAEAEEIITIPR